MCGTSKLVHVLAGPATRSVDEPVPGRVPVDECIAGEVSALNRRGIVTTGACCGHGRPKEYAWIAVRREDSGQLLEDGYRPRTPDRAFPNYAGAVVVYPMTEVA